MRIIATLVAILFALPAYAGQINLIGCYETAGYYDSGNFSERYDAVVFPSWRSVYMLSGIIVDPGDILDVSGESEVTTERTSATMIVTQLMLQDPGTGLYTEISEANGSNILDKEHHKKLHANGHIEIPDTVPPGSSVNIIWRWKADSTDTSPPHQLEVGAGGNNRQDYGRLRAEHKTPCT